MYLREEFETKTTIYCHNKVAVQGPEHLSVASGPTLKYLLSTCKPLFASEIRKICLETTQNMYTQNQNLSNQVSRFCFCARVRSLFQGTQYLYPRHRYFLLLCTILGTFARTVCSQTGNRQSNDSEYNRIEYNRNESNRIEQKNVAASGSLFFFDSAPPLHLLYEQNSNQTLSHFSESLRTFPNAPLYFECAVLGPVRTIL